MSKKLLGLLLMTGVLLCTQGTWAKGTETDERLRALEDKIDSLQKERLALNTLNTNSLSLADKVVSADEPYLKVKYNYPGFKFYTSDGLFSTKLVWRAQMRYTHPNRSDPRSVGNFTTREDVSDFELRRVRMKVGGHGYKKWIKYYFEVDLQPSKNVEDGDDPDKLGDRARVIDWRLTVQPIDEIGFRVGQWKINYNRERVDSSGRQTFVERSIVNRVFTIDRQVGAMLQGRLFKETIADIRYYAGIFNGEGRATNNDDGENMYMGRLQWNFLGRDLKWRQSDVKYHKKPTGQLAFAYATNNGRCTRWSSSGCGNLSAFSNPGTVPNVQYQRDQWVQEFAFKWRGLAIQQEFHQMEVEDKSTMLTHDYQGMYAQIGYTNHGALASLPEGLELAFRYAYVIESRDVTDNLNRNRREEYTVGLNWFLAGHNNKITVDYSYLTLKDFATFTDYSDNRIRLQWDISF
jgi:phosphate-selective porin